jgi:hypothetical protein
MTTPPDHILPIEELATLYHRLNARVERLDGNVRQLLAERTRDALPRPTWRHVEAIKKDIADLQKRVAAHRSK